MGSWTNANRPKSYSFVITAARSVPLAPSTMSVISMFSSPK
jgi:hypothetical protein